MLMHDRLARTIEKFEAGLKDSHRPEDRILVRSYLAELAPVLARAVLGSDVLKELPEVERMFGNSWLHDSQPFENAFAEWRLFRQEYEERSFSAMTVNERLSAASIMDEFDQACTAKDRTTARRLLQSVYLGEADIEAILLDRM
jgi:hypothetical protein